MSKRIPELERALAVPGMSVTADDHGDRIEIRWETDQGVDRILVDLRHPRSVAEATIERLDGGGGEWSRMFVEPAVMRSGIFTACIALPRALLERVGSWPAYVSEAATDAGFYRTVCFGPSDRPGLMVKDQARADEWVRTTRADGA